MANHKSAEKRTRQNVKANTANRAARAALRQIVKKARTAALAKDNTNALALVRDAERALAKAGTKGIVHSRRAAVSTSRLYALLKKSA